MANPWDNDKIKTTASSPAQDSSQKNDNATFAIGDVRALFEEYMKTEPKAPAPASEDPDRENFQSFTQVLPQRGDKGVDVSEMQQALVDAGVKSVGKVDGAFGRNTEKGVQEFQKMKGLPETGIFDEDTRLALFGDIPEEEVGFFGGIREALFGDGDEEDVNTELQTYTDEFALEYLSNHEGLKAHKSLEGGKDTAALGVKFSLGLKRKDYKSDGEFAAAVALKHRDKAKAKFKEGEWDKLDKSVQYALVDLHFNTNSIGSSANKSSTTELMKNTLAFIGMTTKAGEKTSLISLAKRRAWNWNKAADAIGVSKIKKVKQIPTSSGGTKFEYLDADGTVVHSVPTSRKPVKLDKDGVATTLTETREIDL